MDEIERLGGAVAAIEQGFYQQLIADEAYRQAAADRVRRGRGGGRQRVPGRVRRRRRSASTCRRSWSRRSASGWQRCAPGATAAAAAAALARLADAAAGSGDLMPPIVAAVAADATLGEICGALRTCSAIPAE